MSLQLFSFSFIWIRFLEVDVPILFVETGERIYIKHIILFLSKILKFIKVTSPKEVVSLYFSDLKLLESLLKSFQSGLR